MYNQCLNTQPEAYVTTNKNRRKAQGEKIFLENNTTFEIELFNPTPQVLLAKIKINGSYISQRGLILNPGQRVFLERHIDSPEKFLFSTYEVNKNNAAVAKAIEDNGSVEIEFYPEKLIPQYPILPLNPIPFTWTVNNTGSYFVGASASGSASFTDTNSRSFDYGDNEKSLNFDDYTPPVRKTSPKSFLRKESLSETGRVEKGDVSNQSFRSVNKEFEYYTTHVVKYKILPMSEKQVQPNEMVRWCSNCGSKSKKEWKFCPRCSNKI